MPNSSSLQFKPSLISTLLVIVFVLVSLSLAYWQNTRIAEKKANLELFNTMMKTEALNLNSLSSKEIENLAGKSWQKVTVSGDFLEEYQFLLDSQVYKGKPGYNAIVPVKIHNSELVILVNRGWIAAGADRNKIPEIPALTEQQPLQGQLAHPKLAMAGFEQQSVNEKVQLFINMAALSDRIAAPLAPMLLQLDERALGPLPREWPAYQAKVAMHEFYVMHWLVVALFSILLYLYFAFKTKH